MPPHHRTYSTGELRSASFRLTQQSHWIRFPIFILVFALPDVSVSLQACPTSMTGNSGHLRNCPDHLEQTRNPFMPQIVKSQIFNSENSTRAGECSADRVSRIRKNAFSIAGH